MWLTGRLVPDFKTIAEFRRKNGPALRAAYRQFVALSRHLDPFTQAVVAIDGSKFKAVNNRDKNFTVSGPAPARGRHDERSAGQAIRQHCKALRMPTIGGQFARRLADEAA